MILNLSMAENPTITVISYNIKYDNKLDSVNKWIFRRSDLIKIFKNNSPSFIGIQEGLLHQVKHIKSNLPNYEYIGNGRDDGKTKGEFCSIYYDATEYNLIKNSTFWLSRSPLKVSIGWDAALERICTYGYFEHKNSGKRVWVFNTHFDHIGKISRIESSKLILSQIRKLNGFTEPTIVMGDFNDLPNSPTIQTLNKKLDDAIKINSADHIGPIGTFNGFNVSDPISKKIDYIFVKNMEILSHQHLDMRLRSGNHISDHLPVIIKAKIGK